jgi:CDP-diacylglycerol--serine O-phosphatidyltransferase
MPAEPVAAPRAWWRYAVPNMVTGASLVFAILGVLAAVDGHPVAATWWALYCTLTDRLDGALAKALGGGSAFGVQFDSMADLASFGMVIPTTIYYFFAHCPELGWADGPWRVLLVVFAALWLLAAATRLARFNVAAAAGKAPHYTGTPSTMTAGMVGALFLAALKYSDPALRGGEWIDSWYLLGHVRLDAVLRLVPWLLPLGAFGMVSSLRVPRLGRTRHLVTDVLLFGSAGLGYALGLAHRLPEYLLGGGLVYLGLCVAYHLRTR